MLISCPKCNAVYQVSDNRLPQDGKRFKCAECGKIWTVHADDFKNMEPETEPAVKSQIVRPAAAYEENKAELEDIFNRVSQDTKKLFVIPADSIDGSWENRRRKLNMFFSPIMLNCSILLLIFILTGFIAVYNRYEIVNLIPQLETVYAKLGIESVYQGRNITFRNVSTRAIEQEGKHFVEISGVLYNTGRLTTKLLPIKAVMKDSHGQIAAEATKVLTLNRLAPKFSAVFRILLDNKTPDAKTVTLAFDEK